MAIECIDISTWNGSIDFKKVKAAGVKAVIIRAGYGNSASQEDDRFESYYNGAKAVGLKIGAYWYSYSGWGGVDPIEDAKDEAKACLAVIKGKSFDLPIYYDLEEQGNPNIPSFGRATCTRIAEVFCNVIKAGGYKPGVYSNPNWFYNYLDYDALKANYSIWLAQWEVSKYSLPCDIWQYADNGRVNGISGNVDSNVIVNQSIIDGGSGGGGGDTGDSSIKAVQKWLNSEYNTDLDVDGIYGPKTQAGLVKALQTELNRQCDAGLDVDGIYGPKTNAAVPNLAVGMEGNMTKTLQGLLICNGYSTNGFDGIYGHGTATAVRLYQSRHGLDVDGIAGKNTFASLCD